MTSIPVPLPAIGARGFTPSLLAFVHSNPSMKDWSVNPSLFSVLLLTLITKRGGIAVDVPDDSKGGIESILIILNAMTECIFGLVTHHLHLDRYSSPEEIPWRILHPSGNGIHQRITPSQNRQTSYAPSSAKGSPIPVSRIISLRLDQSPTVLLGRSSAPIRLMSPKVLLVSGLENASSPARIKLSEILTEREVKLAWRNDDSELVERLGLDADQTSESLSFDGLIIWVRQEGSEVPSWLLDHFLCSITVSPDDVNLPPPDLGPEAIIPESYINNLHLLLPYSHIRPALQIHISNLLSAVFSHPALKATMTQRAARGFYEITRAHRLLSGGYELPPGWESRLNADVNGRTKLDPETSPRTQLENGSGKFGLGGGRGGVDTWATLAGEEPSVADLVDGFGKQWDGEDCYATPSNVDGVWGVCMRHRVRRRREREEVMWLMKGSAAGGQSDHDKDGQKRNVKKVDGILEEILRTV